MPGLVILVSLAMTAFAANSVFARLALHTLLSTDSSGCVNAYDEADKEESTVLVEAMKELATMPEKG